MMSVALSVLLLVVAVLLTAWATFTLTRLDRLHARVDATYAALDAQLVRRAAALLRAAEAVAAHSAGTNEAGERAALAIAAADVALHAEPDSREQIENDVGRCIGSLAEHAWLIGAGERAELREAAARLVIARRFYNDAVRDTRALRRRRMSRFLHLAGHRELPQFFDIDDTATVGEPQ